MNNQCQKCIWSRLEVYTCRHRRILENTLRVILLLVANKPIVTQLHIKRMANQYWYQIHLYSTFCQHLSWYKILFTQITHIVNCNWRSMFHSTPYLLSILYVILHIFQTRTLNIQLYFCDESMSQNLTQKIYCSYNPFPFAYQSQLLLLCFIKSNAKQKRVINSHSVFQWQ